MVLPRQHDGRRLVGFYLPPYVVVGRPRSFDDVSALFMPHFKYRGIYEIPGKIIQETNAWQPGFHELSLSRCQPVPVPGFHSSRVAGQTAPSDVVVHSNALHGADGTWLAHS